MDPKAVIPAEAPVAGGTVSTLFGTDNPDMVLSRATRVATALAKVIEDRKMYTVIGQGKHVRVEGWQTLGSMVGVFPVVAWTRPLPNGWEARVEARTIHGAIVGAAEAECLNSERNWAAERGKEDHHLRSMAQTRATSKALAQPLRFIIALAGYEGTPAEEMPRASDGVFRGDRKVSQPAEKAATAEADLQSWTGLVDRVTFREGAKGNGEKYTLFTIHTRDGKKLSSFSKTHGETAKYAAEAEEPITVRYREVTVKRGDKTFTNLDVDEIFPAGSEEPAAEPGAQG
jgi:hypothetical protein